MSNKNDKQTRIVRKLMNDVKKGQGPKLSVKLSKTAKRGPRPGPRRARIPKHARHIGDFITRGAPDYPGATIKGKLPFKTWNQMRHVSSRGKVWYEAPVYLPPDIARQYKGLLHNRHMRKIHHQNRKCVEMTLRAFENKYS